LTIDESPQFDEGAQFDPGLWFQQQLFTDFRIQHPFGYREL
jgi:hypothetical protein